MTRALHSLVVTASLVASSAAVPSARADKQSPPPPAAPKTFVLPAHHDVTLDNGLKITTAAYGSVPKTAIVLVIRGGTSEETASETWLARLMTRSLAEGTRSQTAVQLAESAAAMGGSLQVNAGANAMTISLEVLAEFAPRAIALVADVARNPAFPPADVARVQTDLVRALAIARTEPSQLASEQFEGALYPNHPYGRSMPTEAQLKGYTVDQVRAFYAAHAGAARSHVYIAGQFDESSVQKAARGAFADWARGVEYKPIEPASPAPRAVRVLDRPKAVQSTMIVGLPVVAATSPDYVAMQVTDTLLGGFFGSRITSNIREQKGYTYSPFSSVDSLEGNSTWSEEADVTTKDTGASLTEIFKEVKRLRVEAPSGDELRSIQSYLAGVFVLRNSTRLGIITQLVFLERHGLTDDYLRDYTKRVWAVTPADIQRIASTYLDPSKMTIVVVGDRKQIDNQLKPWTANSRPGAPSPRK